MERRLSKYLTANYKRKNYSKVIKYQLNFDQLFWSYYDFAFLPLMIGLKQQEKGNKQKKQRTIKQTKQNNQNKQTCTTSLKAKINHDPLAHFFPRTVPDAMLHRIVYVLVIVCSNCLL